MNDSRFADKKSRAQISQFRLHEPHAARWRNAKNLERWNDSCRAQWEIANLGPKVLVEPQPDTFIKPKPYYEVPF